MLAALDEAADIVIESETAGVEGLERGYDIDSGVDNRLAVAIHHVEEQLTALKAIRAVHARRKLEVVRYDAEVRADLVKRLFLEADKLKDLEANSKASFG